MSRATLTDPATPLNVQPIVAAVAGVGDPIFSDEFRAGGLNLGKWEPWYPDTPFWATTVPGGHKTNTDEPQGYDETGISFVTAGAEKFMRFNFHESNHAVPELAYTSGMVTSYPSFNVTHGVFEARVRVPNVDGSWPAFWRFPQDQGWPPEEDFMENWGSSSFNNAASSAYHRPRPTPGGYVTEEISFFPADFGGVWRTITACVEPGRFRTWFDGVPVMDYEPDPEWQKPMFMILNLAGNKDAPGAAAASAPFNMDVDYVRAWSLDGENVVPDTRWFAKGGVPLTPYVKIDGDLVPLY